MTFNTQVHCPLQISVPLLELPDNVDGADVGPEDHPRQPEEEDEAVLPEPPAAPAEVAPVGGRVDEGGRHEGERRHLDGADERDEEVEPGHGGRQPEGEQVEDDPKEPSMNDDHIFWGSLSPSPWPQ